MKPDFIRHLSRLVLVGALAMAPALNAATANNGDILLGFRAESGTGSNKTYVINLGPASQFENATQTIKLPLGSLGADLTSIYGSGWSNRASLLWGAVGTTGSFDPIGAVPAKTLYGTRELQSAWLQANNATHAAATNKVVALMTAFNTSSSIGTTASNAVLQTTTDINSWASFQPAGENAGPQPGTSLAFFNPTVEASFAGGVAGAILNLYRVKPATSSGEIGHAGDYIGRFMITSNGDVSFVPVSAFGANSIDFSAASYGVLENAGTLAVKLTRSGDISSAASATIAASNGTALASTDFSLPETSVNFAAGEAEKVVTVTILNRDGTQEPRYFTLTITDLTNATLGDTASTTVTISDPVQMSEINLVESEIKVFAESAYATINLSRSVGTSPVTIEIVTEDGSAIAGTDYQAPTGQAKTVTFEDGATEASVNIPLTSASISVNKSFRVKLANPGANVEIGPDGPNETVVRLLAVDDIAPSVVITAPAPNYIVPVDQTTVQVTGTVSDNLGTEKILYSFNNGPFVERILSTNSWSQQVTPVGGVNTFRVKAVDARGNESDIASISFTLIKKGSLTVVIRGGSNVGSVNGLLTGPSAYEVGKTYTLKATAKGNFVFSSWEGAGLASPATLNPVLTFVYTDALASAPTITLNFATSPFVDNEIGEFSGLVVPRSGTDTASSNSTHGFVKLTLTKTGTFSGSLLIDGYKLTISAGSFSASGRATFGSTGASSLQVARANKPSLELSNVFWNPVSNTITGIVKQYYRNAVAAESEFTLNRTHYSSKNKLPASSPYLLNGGLYTVILPSKSQTNGLSAVDFPQGTGVGSIVVSSAGAVKFTGKLADGTAITASASLSEALTVPLFAQVYTNKGSFSAMVQLNSELPDSDLKAVNCVWFRPWQNVQWYPWGWEEGLTLDLLGASYNKTGIVIPGLGDGSTNAELTFSEGLLDKALTGGLSISSKNAVKTTDYGMLAASAFKVALKSATGDLSGTFRHTDGTTPAFVGKVYQKGPNAGAHGYFMTAKPKVIDGQGQSGAFTLLPVHAD